MSTDVAEVVGAALGLNLLFGIPLFPAGLIAGAGAFAILGLQQMGFRRLEAAITALVGVVVAGFAFEIISAKPDGGEVAKHLVMPGLQRDRERAAGHGHHRGDGDAARRLPALGAHPAAHRRPQRDERRRILRFERIDVIIAMSLAGLVNMSMMAMAAALFNDCGLTAIDSIEGAFDGLQQTVSHNAATIFGVALLASGFASSSVGTMAGQVVMQGFIQRRIPIFLRRAITLAPALIVLAIGLAPTDALVISQVVLSFGIPFALVPLLLSPAGGT